MIPYGYLVGGAPLAGKTVWADAMVARHAGAASVSTDALAQELMRASRPEQRPQLFYTQGHDVVSFYAEYDTPEKAVRAALLQAAEMEDDVRREIDRRSRRARLLVVEGVAITPAFARQLQAEFRHHLKLQPIVFYDDDADRVRARIVGRGLWREAGAYPDDHVDHEVAYVMAFHEWYRAEAERHRVLLAHVSTLESIRFR